LGPHRRCLHACLSHHGHIRRKAIKDGLKTLPTELGENHVKVIRATIVRDLAQGQGYFAEALSQYLAHSEVGCASPCDAGVVRWCTDVLMSCRCKLVVAVARS
jgi:hypothetical protein